MRRTDNRDWWANATYNSCRCKHSNLRRIIIFEIQELKGSRSLEQTVEMEILREEERSAGRKQLTGFIVFGTHTQLHNRQKRGRGGGEMAANKR
jgi:hypothetical protein